MQHLHDDALTLLALGEPSTDEETEHLEQCPRCRADLGSFSRVVAAARQAAAGESGDDLELPDSGAVSGAPGVTLPAPDPSVWAGIHRELNLGEDLRQDPLAVPGATAVSRAAVDATDASNASGASLSSLAAARRRRTGTWLAAAAAAVVVAGAGVWGAVRAVDPPPEVVASAELAPLASYSDTGSAVIDRLPDGRRELVVTASSDAAQGFREVWLLAPDASSMVSLGTMDGTEGRFELPADLDLASYPVVDISDEPYDGDPAHSGDSILRGQLDL
ncbi:anti-sigma factor [Arthrobacter sp. ATA002]|uniref:anti-sigma factor n=1 Tax=Arthrobacter sp. ATA002 TaxID=2991715 RepID=UPI0022A67B9E|nr:anti-sigma factor [Arthrobacter sp. ATA002]WAP52985.1 anti-sigma factor [Arthrobacter sp. ATA002]